MSGNTTITLDTRLHIFGRSLTLTGDSKGVFTARLEDPPSLADMIEYLAGFVVPDFRLRLPAPWDSFVAYEPPPLMLTIADDHLTLEIPDLELSVVDGFLDVTSLGLTYDMDLGKLNLDLGVTVLGEALESIEWDPITEPVPPVETKERLFELEYLGLGQRRSFDDTAEAPDTMDAVIGRLSAEDPGLVYDADAGWLFATRLSALRTLDLDLVLRDPNMFGFMVHLRGETAGSFAGLRFEILYRRINAELGVFHTDLELPVAMRRLELGAASFTLSAITIDIYTDGSFLLDLGFPRNLDFSRSFHVEVFPFVGAGGFYVGLLPAGAVPRLPEPATGGRFDPVLAVGIGLNVGVGKTIEMGVLSAAATVTLNAVFEGVLAAYHSGEAGDEDSSDTALYYRASATAALVGRLHGSVDFGIISAQVDILAIASATLVLESHRPTVVLLQASVAVDLHIKILFVTLDFSFRAEVRAEFVIGSAGVAPWELPPGGGPTKTSGRMTSSASALGAAGAGGPVFALTASSTFGDAKVELPLWFIPQVTLAGLDGTEPTVAVVAMLAVDMTEDDDGASDFGHIVERCFRWAAEIVRPPRTRTGDAQVVTAEQLEALQHQLGRLFERSIRQANGGLDFKTSSDAKVRLTPETVLEFWDRNFRYKLRRWSADRAADGIFTIFPIRPTYRFEVTDGNGETVHEVDFATRKPCPPEYLAWLEAWSERLRLATEAEVASEPVLTGARSESDPEVPTLAGVVMVDYFRTVLRSVIGDALDALRLLPYRPGPDETLTDVAKRFGSGPVVAMRLVPTDDEPVGDLVAMTLRIPDGATLALPAAANPVAAVSERCGPDVGLLDVVVANLDQPGVFNGGATVEWTLPPPATGDDEPPPDPIVVTVTALQNDTPNDLVNRLLRAPRTHLQPVSEIDPVELLATMLAATPDLLRVGARVLIPTGATHLVKANETLTSIAEQFDIEPEALLATNAEVAVGGLLHLPDCESAGVGDLIAALRHLQTAQKTGSLVARYFLHGLAVPDPDERHDSHSMSGPADVSDGGDLDGADLVPLYHLAGQQFPVTRDRIGADGNWDEWEFLLGVDDGLPNLTPKDTTPQIETARGFRTLMEPAGTTEVDAVNDLLRDSITAVTQDRPYVVTPVVHPLARPVDWQRPSGGEADAEGPNRLSLIGIPDPVRQLIDRPTRLRVDAQTATRHGSPAVADGGASDRAGPLDVRWVTRIDVVARRLPDPDDRGQRLSGLYTMLATDHRNQADLLAAIDHVTADDELLIAYADPAGGLRSDAVDPDETRLLVTNLSTERRPPDAPFLARAETEAESDQFDTIVPMSDPQRFLRALWRGTVVNQAGFLLDYRLVGADGDDAGPGDDSNIDTSLDAPDGAVLTFLVLWADPPPDEAGRPTRAIKPHHNAAVVAAPPEASTDGTDRPHYEISAATDTSIDGTVTDNAQRFGLSITEFVEANATIAGLIRPGLEMTLADKKTKYTRTTIDDMLTIALLQDMPLDEWENTSIRGHAGIALLPGVEVNVEPRWVRREPLVPGDAVALRAIRRRPDEAELDRPGSAAHLESVYNLVGYEVVANDRFRGSNAGLPLGPMALEDAPTDSMDTPLLYRRMIGVSDLLVAGPSAGPYASIGDSVDIDLSLVDLYGNRTANLRRLSVPVRYRDALIAPSRWPGAAIDYRIDVDPSGTAQRPNVVVGFDVDIHRSLPSGSTAARSNERRIRLDHDLAVLSTVAEQLGDERLSVSVWCSMGGAHRHPVDRNELAAFATHALEWTRAAGRLQPVAIDRGARDPRSLAGWAKRYGETTQAIAEANRDNPSFLETGAELSMPGDAPPRRIVEGETLDSIIEAEAVPLKDLAAANARRSILSLSATVVVPHRFHLADTPAGSGTFQHRLRRGDQLGTLADRFSVSLERLVDANRELIGVLDPNALVRAPGGHDEHQVTEHDTLATLVARVAAEEGREIGLMDFVEANDPPTRARRQGPTGWIYHGLHLRSGGEVLIPPTPTVVTAPLDEPVNRDLVPLEVTIDLERPAALVDRHFQTETDVWRSSTPVRPAEGVNATRPLPAAAVHRGADPGADPLVPLAEAFARAVPGWRLGRESAPETGAFRRGLLVAVRDLIPQPDPRPEFHWPAPLLTHRWSGEIRILRYKDGEVAPDGTTQVEGADLEAWSQEFLSAVESVLDPTAIRRFVSLDPESVGEILEQKRRLAQAVSARTAPILVSDRQDDADRDAGLKATREIVRQRLLRRLDDLTQPGCVIDLPVLPSLLSPDGTDDLSSVPIGHTRLFGVTRVVPSGKRLEPPAVRSGELSCDRTGRTKPRFTTHLAIRPEARNRSSVDVELEWQPRNVEYDIANEGDSDERYHRSRWVTFIVPPEPVRLGRHTMPIVDRSLPDPPTIVADRLIIGGADDGLSTVRRFHYELDHLRQEGTRDRLEGRLAINDQPLTEASSADSAVDDLGRILGEFISVTPALDEHLTGIDDGAAKTALPVFRDMVVAVADAWTALTSGGPMTSTRAGVTEKSENTDDDRSLDLESEAGPERLRSGDAGESNTAVAGPLDGLMVHRVAGELTMVRNDRLVDGRGTNTDFVLRSPASAPASRRRFSAVHEDGIDVTDIRDDVGTDASLERRLAGVFRVLAGYPAVTTDADDLSAHPPLTIELQAWLEIGRPELALRTPIGLWTRRRLDPIGAELAVEVGSILRGHRPAARQSGRWILALRLFSGLDTVDGGGEVAPPLVDYRRVTLDIDRVR